MVAGEIVDGRTVIGHSTCKKDEEWFRVDLLWCIEKDKDHELVV